MEGFEVDEGAVAEVDGTGVLPLYIIFLYLVQALLFTFPLTPPQLTSKP